MLHPDGTIQVDLFDLSPPRSGDTWVAWCLDAHPAVAVGRPPIPGPHKRPEVHRVPSDLAFIGQLAAYRACFAHGTFGQRLVDFTTYTIADTHAAKRIDQHNPEAHLLAVLTHPVARLHDHYRAARRTGDPRDVPPTFKEALDVSAFVATSRYATHLERWKSAIESGRLLVILDQDLERNPVGTLRRIYAHTRVDPDILPPGLDLRTTGPDPQTLHHPPWVRAQTATATGNETMPEAVRAILRRQRRTGTENGDIDGATGDTLHALLADEIDALEDLLGRDLEAWRRPATVPTLTTDRSEGAPLIAR